MIGLRSKAFEDIFMTRTVLGIAFACLFATSSFANGFELPAQPDYSLQRTVTTNPDVDRMTTGSIKPADVTSGDGREQKPRHHPWRKPATPQQP
jgi:hypothetical protein